MTKKLLNLTKVALLIFTLGLSFNSCTKEEYIENPIHETEWYNTEFNIKSSDWEWDNKLKLYYVDRELPTLDNDIYNYGAVIGYVYFGKIGVDEVMTVLPCLSGKNNNERIWFDVSYDLDRSVRFYYQWNNLAQVRPDAHNFKITLIY